MPRGSHSYVISTINDGPVRLVRMFTYLNCSVGHDTTREFRWIFIWMLNRQLVIHYFKEPSISFHEISGYDIPVSTTVFYIFHRLPFSIPYKTINGDVCIFGDSLSILPFHRCGVRQSDLDGPSSCPNLPRHHMQWHRSVLRYFVLSPGYSPS